MVDTTRTKVAQALRLIAEALEQEPALSTAPSDEAPIPERIELKRFNVSRPWLRKTVASVAGPRQQLFYVPSAITAALTQDAQKRPTPRKCKPSDGEDAFDTLLASGTVVSTKGRP
jgi:hypothetical protein